MSLSLSFAFFARCYPFIVCTQQCAAGLKWHTISILLSLPALAYFKDQLALIITGIII